jgi:hypothetical protein
VLSGTPAVYGDYSFTAEVSDNVGSTDEKLFDLHIEQGFICGDVNQDTKTNITDAVYIINFAYAGGPAPDPYESGDVNCDDTVNVSDAVYLVNFIFTPGSPAPCECEQRPNASMVK